MYVRTNVWTIRVLWCLSPLIIPGRLTTPSYWICCKAMSIVINVPVLPTPALCDIYTGTYEGSQVYPCMVPAVYSDWSIFSDVLFDVMMEVHHWVSVLRYPMIRPWCEVVLSYITTSTSWRLATSLWYNTPRISAQCIWYAHAHSISYTCTYIMYIYLVHLQL